MKIPKDCTRAHYMPYWKGDSFWAIKQTAKLPKGRDGGKFIDYNFQVCADGVVGLHWGTARKNGYKYIIVKKGKRRAMTKAELDRPVYKWKLADIKKWRQTPKRGVRLQTRVRPRDFLEVITFAKKKGVIVTPELKSNRFKRPAIARKMKTQVDSIGAVVFPMTLVTMSNWGPKLKAFHEAGFQVALLTHGHKVPNNLPKWAPYIDAYWGANSAAFRRKAASLRK